MDEIRPRRSRAVGGALVFLLVALAHVVVAALVTLSALNATEYDGRARTDVPMTVGSGLRLAAQTVGRAPL